MEVLRETDCPGLGQKRQGKIRDIYDLGEHMLIVAPDRLSALDVVSPQLVPEKGRVLTEMSAFFFQRFRTRFPWLKTHFVTIEWDEIAVRYPKVVQYANQLKGRSTLAVKADSVFQIEVVPRGYLFGTAEKDYKANNGVVCGIQLPLGLKTAERLPYTIITPSTKAPQGEHDENISFEEAMRRGLVNGKEVTAIAATSTLLYEDAANYAKERGILLCDTKFEFGLKNGEIMLIDEIDTPDSSRFWPADQWVLGQEPPSLDKQPVRDYLHAQKAAGLWDGQSKMPSLPDSIIKQTTARYLKALEMLCGKAA
ncbi:MAG: phosphoribosylaminoimidazolesuccinocarboxamide synthase [Candidatus Buchananbacteria bacterium]